MDGLKLTLQRPENERQQNNFYNGWTYEHYVTNLFLFSPDGKIICSYFNAFVLGVIVLGNCNDCCIDSIFEAII